MVWPVLPPGRGGCSLRAMQPRTLRAVVAALAVVASGCDPVLNVFGSFFPAWVVCAVTGIALTLVVRAGFAALGIEAHLGPLVLVYPSLALLLTMLAWLVLYHP
jgi:YtcA family